MDQCSTAQAPEDHLGEPASEHESAGGEDVWIAPNWLIRLVAPWIARGIARRASLPGLEAAFTQAAGSSAIILLNAGHLLHVSTAWGDRITVLLGDSPQFDGLAELCASSGANVERLNSVDVPDFKQRQSVPVLAITPGRGDMTRALDFLTRLKQPVLPLFVEHTRQPLTWRTGLAVPLDIHKAGAGAGHGPILAPPHNAVTRAQFSATIEPMLDNAAARRSDQPDIPTPLPRSAALRAYAAAMTILSPLAMPYLLVRLRAGKEDRKRLGERRGRTHAPRPEGRLVWFHAASVGESLSILPLVQEIPSRGLADCVLVTSGTLTSAQLMGARASDRLTHQFVPLDVPRYARRFLDHWRPDVAIFVESEIWPNLMAETARRQIPFSVINARMSERSFAKWQQWPSAARATLAALDLVMAQSMPVSRRFARLGARDVRHIGNLKFDCPAPPVDDAALESVLESTEGRPLWLAASTHEGEEDLIAEAHFAIRERYPNLLTIIVPRHPDRAANITKLLEERWLVTARRSLSQEISAKIDIYIADTMGELGLFYRLSPVAFIGGSLVETGGHNPIEPAQLDCAVVHGPHVHNFADTYAALDAASAALAIADSGELAHQIADLLSNDARCTGLVAASKIEIARNAGTVERALELLAPQFAA